MIIKLFNNYSLSIITTTTRYLRELGLKSVIFLLFHKSGKSLNRRGGEENKIIGKKKV